MKELLFFFLEILAEKKDTVLQSGNPESNCFEDKLVQKQMAVRTQRGISVHSSLSFLAGVPLFHSLQ